MDCVNSLPWDGTGWPNVMCNQPPCGQLKPSGASVGFAKSLLKEMMGLFPSQVISTGADGKAAAAAVLPAERIRCSAGAGCGGCLGLLRGTSLKHPSQACAMHVPLGWMQR